MKTRKYLLSTNILDNINFTQENFKYQLVKCTLLFLKSCLRIYKIIGKSSSWKKNSFNFSTYYGKPINTESDSYQNINIFQRMKKNFIL